MGTGELVNLVSLIDLKPPFALQGLLIGDDECPLNRHTSLD